MFGVDTLIILGIVAAATIAASQVSASDNENTQNDLLDQQQKNQTRQMAIQQSAKRGQRAAAESGFRSRTEELEPWANKLSIQQGFDMQKQAVSRQADNARTQGWIQGGQTLAGGLANAALSPAAGAAAPSFSDKLASTGLDIGARAAGYALSPHSSTLLSDTAPVQTQPLHPTDPNGGFQLQASDYNLLSGAQQYSQSPFGDDPYGTAPQYQNPNRYRFGL